MVKAIDNFYPEPKGGWPTKFTPERCAAIVDAISHRIPYEYAAEANGISERVLYDWLKIAKQHILENKESDYTKFLQDIKKAEMQRIREHNDMIAAKPERWQADAWILERRWYKHYGPNAQINEMHKKLDNLEMGERNHEERIIERIEERNEKND